MRLYDEDRDIYDDPNEPGLYRPPTDSAPVAPPAARQGPPYTMNNPPPPPPGAPGDLEYRLNPATGEFELHVQGPGGDNPAMTGAFSALGEHFAANRPPAGGGGGYGGGGGNNYALGGGSFDSSGFAWPQYNAPRYQGTAPMQAPAPFAFEGFKAPSGDAIFDDPSYEMRRDEGLQAIEHGAAAKGLSRLPATLKSLAGWNQDFASREYDNINDRAAQTWGMNRNNAADSYSLNYGVSRDVWDRGEKQNLDTFDRNSAASLNEFDFNAFQPAKMTFADLYNRWKSELDANTSIATAGMGD